MEENTKAPAIVIGAIYFAACSIMIAKMASDFGLFHLATAVLVASPIAGGVWIGRVFKIEWVAILFYTAVIAAACWGYYEIWRTLFVLPSDPQSAIALVIGPIYQGMMVGGAAIAALVLDRLVARP